jgi:hypothetical protein
MSAKADTALHQLEDFLSGGQPIDNGGHRDQAAAFEVLRRG